MDVAGCHRDFRRGVQMMRASHVIAVLSLLAAGAAGCAREPMMEPEVPKGERAPDEGKGREPGEVPEQGRLPEEVPEQGRLPEPGEEPEQGRLPEPGEEPEQGRLPEPGEEPEQGRLPEPGEEPEQGRVPKAEKKEGAEPK
jgi:hypothetical protein